MFELLKKKHNMRIQFSDTYITVSFTQATIRESLEFLYATKKMIPHDTVKYFLEHVGGIDVSIIERIPQKDLYEMYYIILDTYLTEYVDGRKLRKEIDKIVSGEEREEKKEGAPMESYFALIIEHTNETIETLLECTWEQVKYIYDGLVWNNNEQTPKGKRENERTRLAKNSKNYDRDEALEMAEKVKRMVEEKQKHM